jgi:pyruvate dehydrogenase E2 component (dihydrolipoamide acetyltransferase)
MYADVVLPNLGFGMEEGRIIAWLKQAGESVRKGEALVEIEGDKSTVELEALADGVLDTILISPDTVVPVGTVLARIRTTANAMPQQPPALAQSPVSEEIARVQISPVARRLADEHGLDLDHIASTWPGGRITREDIESIIATQPKSNGKSTRKALAAPAVRRFARDHRIDLEAVRGTGRDGRVTRADIETALAAAQAPAQPIELPVEAPVDLADIVTPPPAVPVYGGDREEVNLSQMRKAIARRLSQSMQEMPHFYVSGELDFTNALKTLPREIGINNLLLYLTVQALRDVPELNATFEDSHLYRYPHIHLAMAVALPNGLVTPVLRNADEYSLSGLARHARELVTRARDGKLKPDEFQGGTFTISNLGIVKQIDHFTAIINPPQVGILAIGAVRERPVVVNGGLHIRTTAFLTLSADHRVVDGLVSARFIEAFDKHLQEFRG